MNAPKSSIRVRAVKFRYMQNAYALNAEHEFDTARRMLTSLTIVELGGTEVAIQAARNFRALRQLGVTVRKTIDTLIATRCIESGYDLLHDDRDFDPFAKHLGLSAVL